MTYLISVNQFVFITTNKFLQQKENEKEKLTFKSLKDDPREYRPEFLQTIKPSPRLFSFNTTTTKAARMRLPTIWWHTTQKQETSGCSLHFSESCRSLPRVEAQNLRQQCRNSIIISSFAFCSPFRPANARNTNVLRDRELRRRLMPHWQLKTKQLQNLNNFLLTVFIYLETVEKCNKQWNFTVMICTCAHYAQSPRLSLKKISNVTPA